MRVYNGDARMPDALDPRSVIEQAERAAGAGDYLAAERLLRDAASQQETALGPFHPDLVNTLNNLAVVYETIDQPADAERCYRRAYSIAMTSLAPDHPFVATSEKNFRDFCSSRGIPFEPPTPVPSVESTPVVPAPVVLDMRAVEAPVESLPDTNPSAAAPPATDTAPSRSPSFAVLAVAGLVAIVAAGMWLGRSGGTEPASVESPRSLATSPPPETPAPAPAREAAVTTPPVEPPAAAVQPAPRPEVKPAPGPASDSKRPAESRRVDSASAGSAGAIVEDAGLCTELSTREWRCTPAAKEIDPGQLFFYTRVKSPANLTVEHRWYWGDRLHRTVSLYIQSNERAGFRTYSRTAVKPGNWRVELRAKGGPVLHQETFVVR
jgi:hypothetical protein